MKKYLVGGAVRDSLLQLPITEKDWVVVGTTAQEMLDTGYEQVGKDFPVFLDPKNHEEHALARTEKKSGSGYTGFVCHATPQITLKEDLYRRDLTINAIACDNNGNIIDPYHGQKDMKLKILRHVSIFFKDDPLRVLRVARFAAKFFHMNFRIASETLTLMKDMTKELHFLAPERIWTETKKALVTKNPQIYFQVLRQCNALEKIFPEIDILFKIPSSIKYPNINAGEHTMNALRISAQLTHDITVRFAILCHDLGKGNTSKKQRFYHYEHEILGIKIINHFCQRFRIENHLRDFSKKISEYHSILKKIEITPPKIIIRLLQTFDIWRQPKKLKQIILVNKSNIESYNKHFCENINYQQEYFLYQAFLLTKSINVANIIKEGYKKNKISQELNSRRQQILYHWMKSLNQQKT